MSIHSLPSFAFSQLSPSITRHVTFRDPSLNLMRQFCGFKRRPNTLCFFFYRKKYKEPRAKNLFPIFSQGFDQSDLIIDRKLSIWLPFYFASQSRAKVSQNTRKTENNSLFFLLLLIHRTFVTQLFLFHTILFNCLGSSFYLGAGQKDSTVRKWGIIALKWANSSIRSTWCECCGKRNKWYTAKNKTG